MIESGDAPGLSLETFGELRITGKMSGQDFDGDDGHDGHDGDDALQPRIAGVPALCAAARL